MCSGGATCDCLRQYGVRLCSPRHTARRLPRGPAGEGEREHSRAGRDSELHGRRTSVRKTSTDTQFGMEPVVGESQDVIG